MGTKTITVPLPDDHAEPAWEVALLFPAHGNGAPHRLDHADKLHQQVIARGVYDAPPVLLDAGGHHLPI